jgi:flagellin
MGLGLKTNISSLLAQKHLRSSTTSLNQSYERLSSGLRVNRASDDAAGIGIAERLRNDARVATVSMRNANDGISLIAVADGAINQIVNIFNRLLELAQQSANAVYGPEQRSALQSEFVALTSEVERIAVTTEFNGFKILSGGGQIAFQVGFDGSSVSELSFSGIRATLSDLGMAELNSSVNIYSLVGGTNAEAQSASRLTIDALQSAVLQLNRNRGILGAAQSRLETAIRNLGVQRENFQATESGIMDIDAAEESANMTRLQTLQQAGTAILAQANLQPRTVLDLLRD